jgi:hypothetical protein
MHSRKEDRQRAALLDHLTRNWVRQTLGIGSYVLSLIRHPDGRWMVETVDGDGHMGRYLARGEVVLDESGDWVRYLLIEPAEGAH